MDHSLLQDTHTRLVFFAPALSDFKSCDPSKIVVVWIIHRSGLLKFFHLQSIKLKINRSTSKLPKLKSKYSSSGPVK